jgi:hypothetical protein
MSRGRIGDAELSCADDITVSEKDFNTSDMLVVRCCWKKARASVNGVFLSDLAV